MILDFLMTNCSSNEVHIPALLYMPRTFDGHLILFDSLLAHEAENTGKMCGLPIRMCGTILVPSENPNKDISAYQRWIEQHSNDSCMSSILINHMHCYFPKHEYMIRAPNKHCKDYVLIRAGVSYSPDFILKLDETETDRLSFLGVRQYSEL